MASQTVLKKRLKVLMNKPENMVCSDCPERQPRWASLIVPPPGSPPGTLPIGAFCCLECSGSHRRLGVHISFVRSVNLDSWKEREVLAMENGGNKKVNAIFEARLSASGARKPSAGADGQTRERFIRDKYERRKFYDASAIEDYEASSEEESSSEDERAPRRAVRKPVRAPPSEVARRRVESRQARRSVSMPNDVPARAKQIPAKPNPKPPKKPAPAPAPQVDLLDFSADFSKAPDATPAPSTTVAPAPSSAPVDLFANMNVSGDGRSNQPAVQEPGNQAPTRGHSNEQILAMFNTPNQPQNPFGMGMNGMVMPNAGVMGAPVGMMPPQQQGMNPAMIQQQQNMMMMPNNGMMMGGGGMMPQQQGGINSNMNPAMMQQQNMMMMQQQGPGYGNPNMMMQNNVGMQNAVPQQNGNMMNGANMVTQDAYGFPQQPMGGQMQQQGAPGQPPQNNPEPVKNDPFAEFSTNAFRS